jgi:hypothetical protein
VNLGTRKKDVTHTNRGSIGDSIAVNSNRSDKDKIGSEIRSVSLHLGDGMLSTRNNQRNTLSQLNEKSYQ